jgi:hypothetical protein
MFSMRFNARLDASRQGPRIRSEMLGKLRIVWQASTMRRWGTSTLSIGATCTRGFRCPQRYKSRGFKSDKRGSHAVGPPLPIRRSCYVLLRTSRRARLECAGAPSCILSAITHKLNVSGHVLTLTFFLVLACGTRAQSLSAPFNYNLYVCILLGKLS